MPREIDWWPGHIDNFAALCSSGSANHPSHSAANTGARAGTHTHTHNTHGSWGGWRHRPSARQAIRQQRQRQRPQPHVAFFSFSITIKIDKISWCRVALHSAGKVTCSALSLVRWSVLLLCCGSIQARRGALPSPPPTPANGELGAPPGRLDGVIGQGGRLHGAAAMVVARSHWAGACDSRPGMHLQAARSG